MACAMTVDGWPFAFDWSATIHLPKRCCACRSPRHSDAIGLCSQSGRVLDWLSLPYVPWDTLFYGTGEVLAYVSGWRQDEVFLQLKALLEPFRITPFHTDDWGAYRRHLDPEEHNLGKRTWGIPPSHRWSCHRPCAGVALPCQGTPLGDQAIGDASNLFPSCSVNTRSTPMLLGGNGPE